MGVIEKIKDSFAVASIRVLTDSPLTNSVYTIQKDQIELWINTPGYIDGTLRIKGQDIAHDLEASGLSVEVTVGGDPIESLAILQSAKILIMSRSSFSFVAALLNPDGKIFYPPDFWHPKQKSWKLIK